MRSGYRGHDARSLVYVAVGFRTVNGETRGGTYISYSMGVRERSARRQGFVKRTVDGGIGFL